MALHEARLLISIVIPVYNVAGYLRRCVDSLLTQTYTDFEVILVDDGSTDGSGDICDEFGVRVIHQTNAGVSEARNRGIEAARGKYIAFVDADDWVEPDFLEAFAKKVSDIGDPDMVLQGFWDHEGKEKTWSEAHYKTAEEVCSHLFELEQRQLIGYVWNKIFRREVIERYHLRFDPTIPIGEDAMFVMSFLSHATSMAVTPHVGYHYVFSGHKDYSFSALNKRLDCFYDILGGMKSMTAEVRNAFLLKEFRFSLYILHVLYHEPWSGTDRTTYLRKICTRVKGRGASILSLESPYLWLALIVIYLPISMSDFLFKSVIYRSSNSTNE